MHELVYDHIEKQDPSGVRIIIEFPKNPEIDGEKFRQEIKQILSGALRESLGRVSE